MRNLKNTRDILLFVILLGLGVLLFYFVVNASGQPFFSLLRETTSIKSSYLIFVIAAVFLQSSLFAKRWAILMNCYTNISELPKGFIFYNTNIGLLTAAFLPIFGYIGAKAVSCKLEHNISAQKTVFATTFEYLMGITVIVGMLIPSSLNILNILSVKEGILGVMVVIGLLIFGFSRYWKLTRNIFSALLTFLTKIIRRIPLVKNKIRSSKFANTEFSSISRTISIQLMVLSLLIYFSVAIRYFVFLKAFDININVFEFILLYSLGYAISSVTLTPANLGVSELGWFGVLAIVGISYNDAALYAVGQRVLSTGAILLLALISNIYYLYQKRRIRVYSQTN